MSSDSAAGMDLARQGETRPVLRLLDSVFGFVVWAVHLLIIYVATAVACQVGLGSQPNSVQVTVVGILCVVTLAVAGIVVWHAIRRYRAAEGDARSRFSRADRRRSRCRGGIGHPLAAHAAPDGASCAGSSGDARRVSTSHHVSGFTVSWPVCCLSSRGRARRYGPTSPESSPPTPSGPRGPSSRWCSWRWSDFMGVCAWRATAVVGRGGQYPRAVAGERVVVCRRSSGYRSWR